MPLQSPQKWSSSDFTRLLILVLVGLLGAPLGQAAPPDEGDCPTLSSTESDASQDAAPILIKPGMRIDHQGILALQSLIPVEVWRYRDAFFFEGMLMEIGPCHRRYSVPEFFTQATEKLSRNPNDA